MYDLSIIEPLPERFLNLSADCFDHVRVFSAGLWNMRRGESILQHSLFRLNVQIILYVFLACFFHSFLKRFHVPKVSSEILAGFVLGPTLMEKYIPQAAGLVFNSVPGVIYKPNVIMASFAKIGFLFFTFLAAVRMDPSLIRRMGRIAIILGILLAFFPLLMSMSLDVRYNNDVALALTMSKTNLVKTYFSMMTNGQFVGVSYILLQLRITNSRIGHLALATQLISELLRFISSVLLGFVQLAEMNLKPQTSIHSFIILFLFTLILAFGFRPLIYYFIKTTPEDRPVRKFYINVVILVVIASAIASDLVGVFFMYGPFVVGLMIPAGSPLARDLVSKLESIMIETFVPIMVTFCSSKFNLWWFIHDQPLTFYITLIGFLFKLLATLLLALCCKVSLRDAIVFTLIVNYKGALEIGVLFSFSNMELGDVETTSGLLFVLLFSAVIPPLVKMLYDPRKKYIGYDKKCLQCSAPGAELIILACAYRQEDAMAAINLLQFSNPSKQNPLSIYGLCLEELVASSTPVLINHKLGQKTTSALGSRSQPIIDIFKFFESRNNNSTQVNIFTAISHLKQMHEDICWLSFDKAASLIILPFHKKWNSRTKKLMPGSDDLRNLNIDVLGRAPCSVAILVDRRGTRGLSSIFAASSGKYRVGVLFFGGEDDREALAYALRMAGSPKVQLTVTRMSCDNEAQTSWDKMLDNESLRKLKQQMSEPDTNIDYKEEIIHDASGTAALVQEMEESFDLIIVGRGHDPALEAISGLSEWTDLPELGPVGDLLASQDIKNPVSVLIVQHQIRKANHSSILNS